MLDRILPNVQMFSVDSVMTPALSPIFLNLISAVNPLCYVLLTKRYLEKLRNCCMRCGAVRTFPLHEKVIPNRDNSQQLH